MVFSLSYIHNWSQVGFLNEVQGLTIFSADGRKCLLICLFIYFVAVIFFCWTQLLRPHHAERPNMAPSVNRSPGALRKKKGENHPAKFSARWLPVGIIWEPERLFSPSVFPFSCMVSRLEGSTLTLLLTQPLRDSFNSSLSMAPVIELSEREGERERET